LNGSWRFTGHLPSPDFRGGQNVGMQNIRSAGTSA
jgi:hypothetical protein